MKDNFNLKKFISEGKIHSNINRYKKAQNKLINEVLDHSSDAQMEALYDAKLESKSLGQVSKGEYVVLPSDISEYPAHMGGNHTGDVPHFRQGEIYTTPPNRRGAIAEVVGMHKDTITLKVIISDHPDLDHEEVIELGGVSDVWVITNMGELGLEPSSDELNSLFGLEENLEDVDGSFDGEFTDEEVEDILSNMEDNLDNFEGNSYDAEGY